MILLGCCVQVSRLPMYIVFDIQSNFSTGNLFSMLCSIHSPEWSMFHHLWKREYGREWIMWWWEHCLWDGCSSTCTNEIFCGNGLITSLEKCDDNNTVSNDGCSSCQIDTGFACLGSPSVCLPICGDGIIKHPEACDDKNLVSNDGCS